MNTMYAIKQRLLTSYKQKGGVIFIYFRFSKMGTLLSIGYIFMSSIPKNLRILPHARAAHARQSFYFQKITETLKIIFYGEIGFGPKK